MAPDTQPEQMLDYLPQHKVVRCVPCQYAVPPSAIPRHMKDLHHIYRGERRALLEYAAGLDLVDPEDIVLPDPQDPPVPSLPVEDGVACNQAGCKYLSVTRKRMKRHWVTAHEQKGVEGKHWRAVKLQTFFRGNNLKYFIVTPQVRKDTYGPLTKTTKPTMQPNSQSKQSPPIWRIPTDVGLSGSGLGMKDMELFHHYTISTYHGLVHRGEEHPVWQTIIPRFAHSYPFIIDAILSISSLHLANLRPGRKAQCLAAADHYQQLATQNFRSTIQNIDENNCYALFAFCRLTVVHSLASAQIESDDKSRIVDEENSEEQDDDILPEWLKLQIGGSKFLAPYMPQILRGDQSPFRLLLFRPLLSLHDESPVDLSANPCDSHLAALVPLFSNDSLQLNGDGLEYTASADEQMDDAVYLKALDGLRRVFALPYATKGLVRFRDCIAFWSLRQSPHFYELLHQNQPKALIIFAYYSVLIDYVDDYCSGVQSLSNSTLQAPPKFAGTSAGGRSKPSLAKFSLTGDKTLCENSEARVRDPLFTKYHNASTIEASPAIPAILPPATAPLSVDFPALSECAVVEGLGAVVEIIVITIEPEILNELDDDEEVDDNEFSNDPLDFTEFDFRSTIHCPCPA